MVDLAAVAFSYFIYVACAIDFLMDLLLCCISAYAAPSGAPCSSMLAIPLEEVTYVPAKVKRDQAILVRCTGHVLNRSPRPTDLPYGVTPGQDSFQHLPRDNNRAGHPTVKDTKSIEESYERYLQNAQHPSFGSGEPSNFSGTGAGKHGGGMPTGGVHSLPYEDMHSLPYGHSAMIGRPGPRTIIPDMIPNELGMGYGGEFPMDPLGRKGPPPAWEKPLPPNASNTIFVDGLPRGITQREVAHIFRPFVGYKEARLVTKEPKYQDADPVVLCFVDFIDAVHAMRAIDALQGYVMDEKDPDGPILRLQFSRNPGPKPGGRSGPRGKR